MVIWGLLGTLTDLSQFLLLRRMVVTPRVPPTPGGGGRGTAVRGRPQSQPLLIMHLVLAGERPKKRSKCSGPGTTEKKTHQGAAYRAHCQTSTAKVQRDLGPGEEAKTRLT